MRNSNSEFNCKIKNKHLLSLAFFRFYQCKIRDVVNRNNSNKL